MAGHVSMRLFIFLSLLLATALSAQDGFRPLFNGKDLTGWVAVNTAPSTWTVQDGMLICSGKPIGELRTDRMYQNFILEVEWRHMVPKGNAGIFVWADDITARGVPFHRSIEVQVLENAYGNTESHTTHGDIFPIHGATMIPVNGRGGSRAFPTEHLSKPSPEWNHYRITAINGDISLEVNGQLVTQGKSASPRKGYICLESEGGIVHYRNLRIKELPDSPIDPADVAIADRGYRSLYNGLDFSGWVIGPEGRAGWKSADWILSYEGGSSSSDRSIATEWAFGDFGFIFDLRRSQDSGIVRVLLRDSEEGAVVVDPGDPMLAEVLVETGGWDRFEGTLRGDTLTLEVNGHQLFQDRQLPGLPAEGPLRIVPAGPVDFANLFVRSLRDH